ncbi:hypothetical protein EYF80_012042 [Liparis tanakae]|uniref:Uncharacterized protein n=1 Tax=Liparis tanakae TaxID=230148 RepID=A0A4Z2IJU9_9TELE|nr:hypothetical protein EYF80_012042 [Liparis tanakae]
MTFGNEKGRSAGDLEALLSAAPGNTNRGANEQLSGPRRRPLAIFRNDGFSSVCWLLKSERCRLSSRVTFRSHLHIWHEMEELRKGPKVERGGGAMLLVPGAEIKPLSPFRSSFLFS